MPVYIAAELAVEQSHNADGEPMMTTAEKAAYEAGAAAMNAAIAEKLQDWINWLVKENPQSIGACYYAGAKQVAIMTSVQTPDKAA